VCGDVEGQVVNVLERREIERIIGAIDTGSRSGLRARAALYLAYSGLTSGEIVRARRCDVRDLDRQGVISIPSRRRGENIPLRDEVCTALREWLAKAPASEWLLCAYAQGAQGNPISDGDIRAACDRAARDAGIEPGSVSPTVIRESFAWTLAREGASATDIAEIMGFKQLRSVERIMRAPAPDLGDRVRGMSTQQALPAHAAEGDLHALREQVEDLARRVEVLEREGRGATETAALETAVAEIWRYLNQTEGS
jgi:integrase